MTAPIPVFCHCGARIGERRPDGTLVLYFRHHGMTHNPVIKPHPEATA